jgi:DNA-directed RNA polymerase specialized sigma24 family protein
MSSTRHGLNRLERLILILRYYEDLTCTEIAATLSLPAREIEATITRLLRQQFQCAG